MVRLPRSWSDWPPTITERVERGDKHGGGARHSGPKFGWAGQPPPPPLGERVERSPTMAYAGEEPEDSMWPPSRPGWGTGCAERVERECSPQGRSARKDLPAPMCVRRGFAGTLVERAPYGIPRAAGGLEPVGVFASMTPGDTPTGDPPDSERSEEIVVYDPPAGAPANLFGVDDPIDVVKRSAAVAEALAQILVKQGLYKPIGNKRHVNVEGWTLLGSMLGVFPIVVWTKPVHDGRECVGWEARVEARTLAGAIVGAAEAECLRSERRWSTADDYALRSMAQTRATSKALRGPLGFIVSLAGFSPTPDVEIPSEPAEPVAPSKASKQQHGLIGALIGELDKGAPVPDDFGPAGDWTSYSRLWIGGQYGKKSRAQLTTAEAGALIDMLQRHRDGMVV